MKILFIFRIIIHSAGKNAQH